MDIEHFREFVVFAKYLNITRASSELHMTSSSLSKHLKQIEREVGTELFVSRGSKLNLTKKGVHFLNRIQRIVRDYDMLLSELATNEAQKKLDIIAQRAPYDDKTRTAYHGALFKMTSELPIHVQYSKASHRDFAQAAREGKINLFLEYRLGNLSNILKEYEAEGFLAKLVAVDEPILWVSKQGSLAEKPLHIEDLAEIPFMVPTDLCSPVRTLVQDASQLYGFEPIYNIVPTTSGPEFIYADQHDAAYLYPLSYTESSLLQVRDDMEVKHFEDGDVPVCSFLLMPIPSKKIMGEQDKQVTMLYEYFKNQEFKVL